MEPGHNPITVVLLSTKHLRWIRTLLGVTFTTTAVNIKAYALRIFGKFLALMVGNSRHIFHGDCRTNGPQVRAAFD